MGGGVPVCSATVQHCTVLIPQRDLPFNLAQCCLLLFLTFRVLFGIYLLFVFFFDIMKMGLVNYLVTRFCTVHFFWRDRVGWPLLCLCRPFMICTVHVDTRDGWLLEGFREMCGLRGI